MFVLFEDLRLEIYSIYDDELFESADRDAFSKEWRQLYFVRRSLATLNEFSDAIVRLDQSAGFASIKGRFTPKSRADWSDAVAHYEQARVRLRSVRNDIGGHFGQKAALVAIEQLGQAERQALKGVDPQISKIQWCRDSRLQLRAETIPMPLRLHFASQVAAAAIRAGSGDYSQDSEKLVRVIWLEAHNHAYRAASVLVAE